MSHSQFHCTGRVYLDMHGLIFETSICYWQDQPGSLSSLSVLFPLSSSSSSSSSSHKPPFPSHTPAGRRAGRGRGGVGVGGWVLAEGGGKEPAAGRGPSRSGPAGHRPAPGSGRPESAARETAVSEKVGGGTPAVFPEGLGRKSVRLCRAARRGGLCPGPWVRGRNPGGPGPSRAGRRNAGDDWARRGVSVPLAGGGGRTPTVPGRTGRKGPLKDRPDVPATHCRSPWRPEPLCRRSRPASRRLAGRGALRGGMGLQVEPGV